MNSIPKVAILFITYNHEDYILAALESIIDQKTDFDFVVIAGDDCSTDGTRSLLIDFAAKYPEKFKLSNPKENLGPGKNFIQLLNLCTESGADYIAYLEGDDYWCDENKLHKQVAFLEENPQYVCHCHNAVIIENGKPNKNYNEYKIDRHLTTDDLVSTLSIPTGSIMFRNCLKPPPAYLINFPLDIVIYFALSKFGKFYQSTDSMSVYRIHEGGNWTGQNTLEKLDKNIKIKKYYLTEMPLTIGQKKIVKQLIVNIKLNRLKYFANTQFLSLSYLSDFFYLLCKKILAYKFSFKFFIFCMLPENFIKLFKR